MMGKAGLSVSPLAPARFPDLPVIAGIAWIAAASIRRSIRSSMRS